MSDQTLIEFEPNGSPSIVNYTVPEAVSYDGVNIIELDIDPAKFNPPPIPPLDQNEINALNEAQVESAMAAGFADVRMFPDLGVPRGHFVYAKSVTTPDGKSVPWNGIFLSQFGPNAESEKWMTPELRFLRPDDVLFQLKNGGNLAIVRLTDHRFTVRFLRVDPKSKLRFRQRLALIESYRLSSFLGAYGAGRVVNTFALLPGEKATITVKNFKRTVETLKESSTILDSLNDSSASDFENTVQEERSDKSTRARMDSWHVEAELSGSFGIASAKVEAGYKGSSSSAREQFAASVSNSVNKHVQQASSKRDVKVEQSTETTNELLDEKVTERELRNINVGHSLNFVFRQLNQEFYTLLHLYDVRIGYTDGITTKVVPLFALDELLVEFLKTENDGSGQPLPEDKQFRAGVKQAILDDLSVVFDSQGKPHNLVERVERRDSKGTVLGSYQRVRKGLKTSFQNPTTKTLLEVEGIIVAVSQNVIRTDGIITEALLGRASSLDPFSQELQNATVAELKLKNDLLEQQLLRERSVQTAVGGKNTRAVALLKQLYPPPEEPPVALAVPANAVKGGGKP